MAKRKGKIRNGAHVVMTSILAVANVVAACVLFAVCLSTRLDPATYSYLSLLGLTFPVVLAINFAFVVVWLVVKRGYLLVPVVSLVLCWGYVRDYFPLNFTSVPDDGEYIKVLSFNTFNFTTNDDFDGQSTADYIAASDADIICLQEYNRGCDAARRLESMLDSAGYDIAKGSSLLIATKGRICESAESKGADSGCGNGIQSAAVVFDQDTVLVNNAHLESTGLSLEQRQAYQEAVQDKDRHKLQATGKSMIRQMAATSARRSVQAHILDSIVGTNAERSVIVCGDMNETPISHTVQLLSRNLENAYTQSGNGVGVSYRGKDFPVRIDHVFVSSDWECLYTYIDNTINSSDHYPIVSFLRWTPKKAL